MLTLTKNEEKVFMALSYNLQSVSSIVEKLKMPRMTVYSILLRLKGNNLALQVKQKDKKRLLWSKANKESIKKGIQKAANSVLKSSFEGDGFSEHGKFMVFKGKDSIKVALMSLTQRREGAHMFSIQNSDNFKRWIDLMGKTWVNLHNRAVVENKLICFTIHSESVPKEIVSDQDVLDAYKGRLGNSHAVSKSFLKRGLSFYIFDDTIFFVNLEKLEAFSVDDAGMASFLIKVFSFMFERATPEEFFLKYNR